MNNIIRAVNFAAIKHKNQRRKDVDKTPYINHPIEVANLLINAGVKEENSIIAALLHDTIEDTETTKEEITEYFGIHVCNLVLEVTDDNSLSKVERKRLQVYNAHKKSNGARLIKLADKYSNCSSLSKNPPANWSPEVVKGYIYWSFAVVSQFYGLNRYFDDIFLELFKKHGIIKEKWSDVDKNKVEAELEEYYKIK